MPWPFDPRFATIAAGTAPDRRRPRPRRRPAGRSRARARGLTVADGVLRLRNDDPAAGVGRAPGLAARARTARTPFASRPPSPATRSPARGPAFASARSRWSPTATSQRPHFSPMQRLAGLRGTPGGRRAMSSISTFPSGARGSSWRSGCATPPASSPSATSTARARAERPWFRWISLAACSSAWAVMLAAGLLAVLARGIDHRAERHGAGAARLLPASCC